jgi:hypothetical protein
MEELVDRLKVEILFHVGLDGCQTLVEKLLLRIQLELQGRHRGFQTFLDLVLMPLKAFILDISDLLPLLLIYLSILPPLALYPLLHLLHFIHHATDSIREQCMLFGLQESDLLNFLAAQLLALEDLIEEGAL